MTVEVPVQADEVPKVTLPDGTEAALTDNYQITGVTEESRQWVLTVHKVTGGGTAPLAGAEIALYADENCHTLIRTGVSGQDGMVSFLGLIKGQHYWVSETAAPEKRRVWTEPALPANPPPPANANPVRPAIPKAPAAAALPTLSIFRKPGMIPGF